MPRSSDKSPRNRRAKTNEEKRKLHNKKNKQASLGAIALTKFYPSNTNASASSDNPDPVDGTPIANHDRPDNRGHLVCRAIDGDGAAVADFSEFIGDDMHVQPRDIVATLDLEDGNDDAMDDKLEAEEPAAEVTCGDANETGTQPLGCATVGRCTLLRVHAALSGAAVERRALVRPCAAPDGATIGHCASVRPCDIS